MTLPAKAALNVQTVVRASSLVFCRLPLHTLISVLECTTFLFSMPEVIPCCLALQLRAPHEDFTPWDIQRQLHEYLRINNIRARGDVEDLGAPRECVHQTTPEI